MEIIKSEITIQESLRDAVQEARSAAALRVKAARADEKAAADVMDAACERIRSLYIELNEVEGIEIHTFDV